jgi:murein DD-endopeptidase MepM/ murein hydrolase activator NlpD
MALAAGEITLGQDAGHAPGRGVTIANPVPQGHGWVNPRRSEVGQGDGRFGPVRTRIDPQGRPTVRNHNGLDLAAPAGTRVRAPVPGIVIRSVPNWRGQNANGNEVRILGDDGREYWFFHLSGRHQPAIGQRVEASEPIGEVGRTAIPAGAAAHLHFEVRENGQPVPIESIGGDHRAGMWNYILAQPQTTQEEADMINRFVGQPTRRQPSYIEHPAPAPAAPTAPASQPSLFDRVLDFLIPSAHGQSLPQGAARASRSITVDESAADSAPSRSQVADRGDLDFDYDDQPVQEVPLPETRGHIRPEDSIENGAAPPPGTEPLYEDHNGGYENPQRQPGAGGGLYLPAPGSETPQNPAQPSQPGGDFGGLRDGSSAGPSQPAPRSGDFSAPSDSPAPSPRPGLTPQQLRREIDRSMEEIRRADEFNRQNPLSISPRPRTEAPAEGDFQEPSLNGRRDEGFPQIQPTQPRRQRNGDSGQPGSNSSVADFREGYSPQPQSVAPPQERRNRVYWDGGSRPIGSQTDDAYQQYRRFQEWSNQQIREQSRDRGGARSPGGRYYSEPAATPTPTPTPSAVPIPSPTISPSPVLPYSSSAGDDRPTYSIEFDDDAPRATGRSRFGYDESLPRTGAMTSSDALDLPSGSAVERRSAGQSAATASLAIP